MKKKSKKIINSFKYAFEGIFTSFKTERNMKIHVLAMIIVIAFGFYLKLNSTEWCIITIIIALVLTAELFNTAIETIVDMICPEKNPKPKLAKDISAAAVLSLAVGAVIIGTIIFIPKLII